MSVTNFQISHKTKRPACCDFDCCGNHFGRIERRFARVHGSVNRIVKTRRYAKRVERRIVKSEILAQLNEELLDYIEDYRELEYYFTDTSNGY